MKNGAARMSTVAAWGSRRVRAALLGLFVWLTVGGVHRAWAHAGPPGCSGTGVTLELLVVDANGNELDLGQAVKECTVIAFKARISKPAGDTCAFEGGTVTITTPDGVSHDVTP